MVYFTTTPGNFLVCSRWKIVQNEGIVRKLNEKLHFMPKIGKSLGSFSKSWKCWKAFRELNLQNGNLLGNKKEEIAISQIWQTMGYLCTGWKIDQNQGNYWKIR